MSEKMKKYIQSVARRLNLSKGVRERVISDFESSIAARLESGMSEEEVYAELGTPKKAAADLNEQMKGFTYHKSPWRFLFAGLAVYSGVRLLDRLWTQIVVWWVTGAFQAKEGASIGIICGADGPTAIFVTTPVWTSWALPALLLVLGIWGFLRLRKCKQK